MKLQRISFLQSPKRIMASVCFLIWVFCLGAFLAGTIHLFNSRDLVILFFVLGSSAVGFFSYLLTIVEVQPYVKL